MIPAWAGTTIVFAPTGCLAREDPGAGRADRAYKIVDCAARRTPVPYDQIGKQTVYLASLRSVRWLSVTDSSVDADILRSLADAFDAGADLIEPSELLLSCRSADDVDCALAAMRRHRPELFRAVLDGGGRIVAITGITPAGRHIARTWSSAAETSAGSSEGRGATLCRQTLRMLIGAAVAVVVRVVSDHLPLRD